MISKAKWQTYIQKLAAIDAKAAEMIRQYIDTNGLENSQELIEYAHGIVTKYGEASAELSCEMYDLMAKTQGAVIPPAEPADTATIDEVARGVQWGKYHSPNQIPNIVGRQTRQAGADTMIKNAIRDQAEWAWIPSGDTCAFCITLASRGWQTASKKVLKGDHAEHIHQNCDCTFGIAFNEKGRQQYDRIYDPQKYADMYYGADGKKPQDKINALRRARYHQNPEYFRAQKRDAYQARLIETRNVLSQRYQANNSPVYETVDYKTALKAIKNGENIEKLIQDGKLKEIDRVYRSIGARGRPHYAYNPIIGEVEELAPGPFTQPKDHIIAGGKRDRQIDVIDSLLSRYPETQWYEWTKEKGFAFAYDDYGDIHPVEIHWYSHPKVDEFVDTKMKEYDGIIYLDEL